MADKINVKIKAKAYERSHPKTNLSEFENDLNFVDRKTFEEELIKLRRWIIDHFAGVSQGDAVAGGNLYGADVAARDELMTRKLISGGNVSERVQSVLRLYFYGGHLTEESKSQWDC